MLHVERTEIDDVLILDVKQIEDARGFLSETFSKRALAEVGIVLDVVQENHTHSGAAGTIRGLHFQRPPAAQAKVLRVISGAILDVAVDLRQASPSFGRHVAVEISRANWRQMVIPVGFAHGFATLEPNTEVIYKLTAPYVPELEDGIDWADKELGIDWPIDPSRAVVSKRDLSWPRLAEIADGLPF